MSFEIMQTGFTDIAKKSCTCTCSCSACNCSDRPNATGSAGRQAGYSGGNSGHDYIANPQLLLL